MTTAVLVLLLASRPTGDPNLSLEERCAVVGAVLQAQAKRGVQGGERPRVEEVSFPALTSVRRLGSSSPNRTFVEPRWKVGRRYRPIFASSESCNSDWFIREEEVPEARDVKRDPKGNSDTVVVVTLRKVPGKATNRFAFEERLGLSIHSYLPEGTKEGGYAVPPAMYRGTVEKTSEGTWIAKVEKAIFAS